MIKKQTQKIKTSKLEIAEFWKCELEAGEVNVNFKNATTHCWRCGVKKRLDRCHIVPHSQGGEDSPENFVLLCKHCHFENPNLSNVEVIWKWLKAYKFDEGETFWFVQGEREFEFIYSTTIEEALAKKNYFDRRLFNEIFEEKIKEAGHHFGQPRRNKATVAGIIALCIESLEVQ